MRVLRRCDACDRIIWPWQHFGFITRYDGKRVVWHVFCDQPPWSRK